VFDLNQLDAIGGWLKSLVQQRAGPLSGLVHSAGMALTRPLQIMQAEHFESVLRINLLAGAMLARGFRQKGVAPGGGAIVFISSVAGLRGWSGFSAYAASKAGLHGLTRSLAVELAGERIRVNAIAAGAVQTPLLEGEAEATGDQRMQAIRDMHPLGIGDPLDVAHAVAFLLADTGRWITGAVLPVDGGCSA
jgi:NAD(P)-dependent dehydrogenase (short-subunit alcohol dehydrogenase family)